MTTNDDDRLREDLRVTFGRDLPDGAFAESVQDRIEAATDRHREIGLPPPRRRLVLPLVALAAAAILVVAALRLWPSTTAPGEAPSEESTVGAGEGMLPVPGPPGLDLPPAEAAGNYRAHLVLEIRPDRTYRLDGEEIPLSKLSRELARHAAAARSSDDASKPSDLAVLLWAYRKTPWTAVQLAMQACADPSVRIWKLQFAVLTDGAPAALPVPLPTDPGIGAPRRAEILVQLDVHRDGSHLIRVTGEIVGSGDIGYRKLTEAIAKIRAVDAAIGVRIAAGPKIPHETVVRAIDAVMLAGVKEIVFLGTPPSRLEATAEDEVIEEEFGEDAVEDEVFESALELPSARMAGAHPMHLTITVRSDGTVELAGKRMSLDALRSDLARRAGAARSPGDASKPSDLAVLLRVDRRTPWRAVQLVMQTCADPFVRIWKLQFAVRKGDGTASIPVPLPFDRGLGGEGEVVALAQVQLSHGNGRDPRISLTGRSLGMGEDAYRTLTAELARIRKSEPDLRVDLSAQGQIRHAQVVQAIDAVLAAGVEDIRFVDAPPAILRDQPIPPMGELPLTEYPAKQVRIAIRHVAGGETEVSLEGRKLGRGEDGLRALRSALARLPARAANRPAILEASPELRHADVLRVAKILEEAGFRDVALEAPRVEKVARGPWTIRLIRGVDAETTTIRVPGQPVVGGEAGFGAVETWIAGLSEEAWSRGFAIDASSRVPPAEVIRVLNILMKAGVKEIVFIGTPRPRPR